MRLKHLGFVLAAVGLAAVSVSNVRADVSAAGVLFLKLPPGARAAAMGESFVAVANDATATHWNPAGLGTNAFSSSWVDNTLPEELRPFSGFAAVKARGGGGSGSYDIWAITAKGLARFNGKDWTFSEKIVTRTDQQMDRLVSSFFSVNNENDLADRMRKIAEANSRMSYASFVEFLDGVLADIPEDAKQRATITTYADSLKLAYDQCLVGWDKIDEAKRQLASAKSDGKLASVEIDRIMFPLERARNKYLPEQLEIPFSAGYSGEATVIEGKGEMLLLGTTEGLFQFTDRKWLRAKADDPQKFIPPVQSILPLGPYTLVGFTDGVAKYLTGTLSPVDGEADLPKGPVSALAGTGIADVWAVINNDLFYWNGTFWANWMQYTTVLDDTASRIAEKFALYGTQSEIDGYMKKFNEVNEPKNMVSSGLPGNLLEKPAEEPAAEVAEEPAAEEASEETPAETEGEAVANENEETHPASAPEAFGYKLDLSAGQSIRAPFLSGIKGKVTAIYAHSQNDLWLGTEYGLYHFNGSGWEVPGYADYTPTADESVSTIASRSLAKRNATQESYAHALVAINDLEGETVPAGKTIKVYRNAAAAPIRSIDRHRENLYVATSEGMLQLNSGTWSRAGISDMGTADAQGVQVVNEDAWLASSDKIAARSNGHSELALMHVQLLPGLNLEDVYYEFLSFVTNIEGWGGVGIDISFLSLGKNEQTDANNQSLGDFYSFETAVALAYGTSISSSLKGGLAAKVIYSRLSPVGAGDERGSGTTTGFAIDGGLLWFLTDRLTFGTALRNIGPDISYIDAAQSDPLPRTLSLGFSYELAQRGNLDILLSTQIDKELVAMDDGFSKELEQTAPSAGVEFVYADIFAVRGGYRYDGEDPRNSVATFGAGLVLVNRFKFDFAYTPGFTSEAQKNTLRSSLGIMF